MQRAAELRAKADQYRKMAEGQTNQRLIDAMQNMAKEYDQLADQLEHQTWQNDGTRC